MVWVAGVAELWCMPAAAAPIGPLAWEPPYAAGAAPSQKREKQTKTPPQNAFGCDMSGNAGLVMLRLPHDSLT